MLPSSRDQCPSSFAWRPDIVTYAQTAPNFGEMEYSEGRHLSALGLIKGAEPLRPLRVLLTLRKVFIYDNKEYAKRS